MTNEDIKADAVAAFGDNPRGKGWFDGEEMLGFDEFRDDILTRLPVLLFLLCFGDIGDEDFFA